MPCGWQNVPAFRNLHSVELRKRFYECKPDIVLQNLGDLDNRRTEHIRIVNEGRSFQPKHYFHFNFSLCSSQQRQRTTYHNNTSLSVLKTRLIIEQSKRELRTTTIDIAVTTLFCLLLSQSIVSRDGASDASELSSSSLESLKKIRESARAQVTPLSRSTRPARTCACAYWSCVKDV